MHAREIIAEKDIVIKTIRVKKTDGKMEQIKIKYSRKNLNKPVYLLRRD